ncbi:hypothetical protein AYJ54_14005 [Bradyrhizobium centrolobii]|uniref:Methyltransferase domain-containing protein n=1 Tax=Bradyrhizobium centrolobii TaxID=1505087 RepID=A0A176YQW7_9BRAD|nr:class I SAM-dependent methyltransferase [Bradyrhizobium centrolobii]OAF08756.1 hypothetical protein AYJ54_14005 [Bradyrhizobium centrolobii]
MDLQCRDELFDSSHPLPSHCRAYRQSVQHRLLHILRQNPGCRFLEIGVGSTFRKERFKTIDDLGINYVGLDVEHVCAARRADLSTAGIVNRDIRLLGNYVGTYLFNLIRLARRQETFDIIYLDGSHSIYVDLAAATAAVRLLKPGALFLFDDVRFTFGSGELIRTAARCADRAESKQLTEEEANEPHVAIIIRDYLIPLFNFEVERSSSNPDWIALRAPRSAPWMRT